MTDENKQVNLETDESLNFNDIEKIKPKSITEDFEEELQRQSQSETEVKEEALDPTIKDEAKKFGHQSKEEWVAAGKDPSKWKPEEEFVRYGREYKEVNSKLKTLEQQNADYIKKIDILVEAQKRKEEQAVFQAKKQLEMELQQAKEMGNVDAVQHLTQEKVKLDQISQNEEIEKLTREIQRIDNIFTQRNAYWFNASRPDLLAEVNEIAAQRKRDFPNEPYADKARLIEAEIKLRHPELSVNTTAQRPQVSMSDSAVTKSEGSASSSEDRLLRTLSSDEKAEYNVLRNRLENSRLKIKYTVKEYIDSKNTIEKRGF